eukprot:183586-Amorphochlora_amoeboformis.AAC.1
MRPHPSGFSVGRHLRTQGSRQTERRAPTLSMSKQRPDRHEAKLTRRTHCFVKEGPRRLSASHGTRKRKGVPSNNRSTKRIRVRENDDVHSNPGNMTKREVKIDVKEST